MPTLKRVKKYSLEWAKTRISAYKNFVREHKKIARDMLVKTATFQNTLDDLREQRNDLDAKIEEHEEILRKKQAKQLAKLENLHGGMQAIEDELFEYLKKKELKKEEIDDFTLQIKESPAKVIYLQMEEGCTASDAEVIEALKESGFQELVAAKESVDKNAVKKVFKEGKLGEFEVAETDLTACYLGLEKTKKFSLTAPKEFQLQDAV